MLNPLQQSLARAQDLLNRERWDQARELLQPLVRQKPQWEEGLLLLAQANYQLGKLPEAFQGVRQVIGLGSRNSDCYLLLGHILRQAGHAGDATDAYRACLELQPDHVTALMALGNLSREQRQTRTARQFFEAALKLRPNDPNILTNLATVLGDVGLIHESIQLLESALRANPAAREAHSNLLLTRHYDADTTPELLARDHRLWADRHASGIPRLKLLVDRDPERKLRLGFVSADFKNHPVGRLMEVLWRHLSPELFDIFVYDSGTLADSLTALLRPRAHTWRALAGMADDTAATLIQQDRIDVLFDLSGHTAGNRLLMFARKPAPLQVTWFAYPNTTGLPAVDLRITDDLADPPGLCESRYVEWLLRFKRMAWLYRPPDTGHSVKPLPHTRGHPFTFGCLNNPAKTSTASLDAWAEILRGCPAARLLLLVRDDSDYLADLTRRFVDAGAQAGQLKFVHSAPPTQFFDYHYEVDLILDPFPYNGAVTTCDALWMGVPVLSLAGDSYASRQGVTLLTNLGLKEWIADSVPDYVHKAIEAATHPQPLAALNTELRGRLTGSEVMNYAGFSNEFTTLVREQWRAYCASPA